MQQQRIIAVARLIMGGTDTEIPSHASAHNVLGLIKAHVLKLRYATVGG
jgi:hypothetical protein